jgi:hypothetical protein
MKHTRHTELNEGPEVRVSTQVRQSCSALHVALQSCSTPLQELCSAFTALAAV